MMFKKPTKWPFLLKAFPIWQPATDFWAKATNWPYVGKYLRSLHDDSCKGCGICASTCPKDAIKIRVDDENKMLTEFYSKIDSYVDIVSEGK